jgi:ankyrin repeat protein
MYLRLIYVLGVKMIDRELFNAALDENLDLVKKLIKEGKNINSIDEISGENLLFKMISFNNEKVADFLVEIGANVNNSNNSGKTILMEAASRGLSTKFIKKLISRGVDIDKTDDFGGNVLWWTESKSTINYFKSIGVKLKKKISYIQSNSESFEDYFIIREQPLSFLG